MSDDVEVIVFHNRRKVVPSKRVRKVKSSDFDDATYKTEKMHSKELLEKIQHEVESFGNTGYSKEEQRKRLRMKAVKLGAKPPKKGGINYKEYLENRRMQDEKQKVEKNNKTKPKLNVKMGAGKYKNGVLNLTKQDIKAITK